MPSYTSNGFRYLGEHEPLADVAVAMQDLAEKCDDEAVENDLRFANLAKVAFGQEQFDLTALVGAEHLIEYSSGVTKGLPFTAAPWVVATPVYFSPGMRHLHVRVFDVTPTNFRLYAEATDLSVWGSSVPVNWIAMGI